MQCDHLPLSVFRRNQIASLQGFFQLTSETNLAPLELLEFTMISQDTEFSSTPSNAAQNLMQHRPKNE